MNLIDYARLIEEKLKNLDQDINDFLEKDFQIHCADVLIDKGYKVFMEYPFIENKKDECDIVITKKDDCLKVKTWIELKPIWEYPNSNYWQPSKFIDEAPFRHDVEKLSQVSKDSNAWFVMILFSEDKSISIDNGLPKKGIRLSTGQVIGIISKWANGEPLCVNSFQTPKNYCHVVCWNITEFRDVIYVLKGSVYQIE